MLIAIDPGTDKSARLIWHEGKVYSPAIMDNHELLSWLRTFLLTGNHALAVEGIQCLGMPVGKEVFETCMFIGRIQEIVSSLHNPFRLVYRREVKIHLCGSMKAKDPNIRQALIDRFGHVGTKKANGPLFGVSSHLWSALAVAVTASETK